MGIYICQSSDCIFRICKLHWMLISRKNKFVKSKPAGKRQSKNEWVFNDAISDTWIPGIKKIWRPNDGTWEQLCLLELGTTISTSRHPPTNKHKTKQKLCVSNKQSFKINSICPFPTELQVLVLLIRNSGAINVNLTLLGQPATQTEGTFPHPFAPSSSFWFPGFTQMSHTLL